MTKHLLLFLLTCLSVCGQPEKKVAPQNGTLAFPESLLIDTTVTNLSITEFKNYLPDSVANHLQTTGKLEYSYNTTSFTLKIRYHEYKKAKPELDLFYIKLRQKTKAYFDSLVSTVAQHHNTKPNIFKGANFYQAELKPDTTFTTTFKITWMLGEDPEFFDIDINMGNNKMYGKLPD